jgi:hypothetical protein
MVDDEMADAGLSLTDLFTYDHDLLLEELGRNLVGPGFGFGPGDIDRFRRIAIEWLAGHAEQLRQKVCINTAVQAITNDELGDKISDAAVVADAISSMLGRPSASIVAVILVRRGLAAFCSGESPTLSP